MAFKYRVKNNTHIKKLFRTVDRGDVVVDPGKDETVLVRKKFSETYVDKLGYGGVKITYKGEVDASPKPAENQESEEAQTAKTNAGLFGAGTGDNKAPDNQVTQVTAPKPEKKTKSES